MTTAIKTTKKPHTLITCQDKGFFANVRKATHVDSDARTDRSLFLALSGADYGLGLHQASNPVTGNPVPSQFFVIRDSDSTVVAAKTVTESYGVVTPTDLVASVAGLVDAGFLEMSDFMLLTKEGIAGNGEIVTLKMVTDQTAAGENLHWFLVLTNFHGAGKVKARIVCNRPWCLNQMGAIMAEFDWAVSHRVPRGKTERAAERIIDAGSQWDNLTQKLQKVSSNFDALQTLSVPDPDKYIFPVLGIDPKKDLKGAKKNLRTAIMDEFNNPSRGTFGRTGWDLINAVTAVNTHGHESIASKADNLSRAGGILVGSAGTREEKMMRILLAEV